MMCACIFLHLLSFLFFFAVAFIFLVLKSQGCLNGSFDFLGVFFSTVEV